MDKIFNNFLTVSPQAGSVLIFIFGLLVFFSTVFFVWSKVQPKKDMKELIDRTNSWWKIMALLVFFLFINKAITMVGLAFLSFVALRELLSRMELDETNRKLMFWCYLSIPVQFYAAYIAYYRFFIVWIPVVLFIILPTRRLIAGHVKDSLKSVAVIQWALMLTVFSLSHIAYLLSIDLPMEFTAGNESLILFLIFLTQFNDVLQFIWGKAIGRHKIIPKVSPNKTWEGFLGGLVSTTILAYYLKFLTPFSSGQAIAAGALLAFFGFLGDLNISAIKRDLGVKDMGNAIAGHGGFMDRLDSLSFTGMVFFHMVHIWMVPPT